ncbi:MAG: hypothetical protein M3421_02565 [Bacteroidota bacterium]|nr:hypothetical protein [Bacteroidota bacterium]
MWLRSAAHHSPNTTAKGITIAKASVLMVKNNNKARPGTGIRNRYALNAGKE